MGQAWLCCVGQFPVLSHFCARYLVEPTQVCEAPQTSVVGWFPLSTHTCAPVAQEIVPVLQTFVGWQLPPPAQVHAPAAVQ